VHGRDYQSSREHAAELGAQRGLETVPPFHPDLVLGVATYARELFGAAGELDAVYVPVGMRVAVIHTGGNADTGLLLQVLAGQTPAV